MSPPPSNGKTVLVSGINGYIASVIGLDLLKKGYTLRGTLRNEKNATALTNGAYKDFQGRVELQIVSDMTADGAFDEAVKGVTAVIHTASPISYKLTTWDEVVVPAIQGSLSILHSAYKHAGPQLESFVVTSSVAAIFDPSNPSHEFTEADWNEWAEPRARESGDVRAMYPASKTLAEKAIWQFRDEKKPPFSISSVLPGVVTGPPAQPPPDPSALNITLEPIWTILHGQQGPMPSPIGTGSYIDVRDVSAMHVWCAEHPAAAAGQRYLLSNGRATPQAVADLLRRSSAALPPGRRAAIPVGTPGAGYEPGYGWPDGWGGLRSEKARRALGVRAFVGFEKSVLDTVEVFERVYGRYLEGAKA